MKILADMHVHTTFSVDAKDDLESMCQSAIEKGLDYICFTEHFDLNPRDEGYGFFQLENFSKAIDLVRLKFSDCLCILKGLEFSEPHLYPRDFERMVTKDFDVVIAAIHWIDSTFIGDKALRECFTTNEIFERYYKVVLDTILFGGFDVLAHLDLPKRYLGQYPGQSLDSANMVDEVLKEMAKSDIALEINTSPLRKGVGECSPDFSILQRYVEAGGSKITVGSDAHSCSEIAVDFEYVQNLIGKTNGGQVGIYKRRKFVPTG